MSSTHPQILLKKGKTASILRKHPWVFSGAIDKIDTGIKEGMVVEIFSSDKKYLATAHYATGSIAARIISFEPKDINISFWEDKIKRAWDVRHKLELTENNLTNAFRLIHAEGDGMPGLIADYYNGTVVIQAHSLGMHLAKNELIIALKNVLKDNLKAIFDKSADTLNKHAAVDLKNDYLFGNFSNNIILENNCKFKVHWEEGQKTGFFLDQRENRKLLKKYAKGKSVLNTFCYSGGFSIYALTGGASLVHSVDSSKKAIEWTEENVKLNGNFSSIHTAYESDVMEHFHSSKLNYDIIILDPPAFAKKISSRHNAVQGYKRLAINALKKINPGGLLFTFSCSQVVDRILFERTILSAAIESGKNVRILHHLSQSPDHCTNIYHPEGNYLKGLVLYVE